MPKELLCIQRLVAKSRVDVSQIASQLVLKGARRLVRKGVFAAGPQFRIIMKQTLMV